MDTPLLIGHDATTRQRLRRFALTLTKPFPNMREAICFLLFQCIDNLKPEEAEGLKENLCRTLLD